MGLIEVYAGTLGASHYYEARFLGAVPLRLVYPLEWDESAARACAVLHGGALHQLEGLVDFVIAEFFALSGQPGVFVFMGDSLLVRLGVVLRRLVSMHRVGEDDDGVRGGIAQTCGN